MLAYIHQTVASERDFLASVLSASPSDAPLVCRMLDAVSDGLTRPLFDRLAAVTSAAGGDAVTTFRLCSLLYFYLHTIGKFMPESALVAAIRASVFGCAT
jgi:hypothetical protein